MTPLIAVALLCTGATAIDGDTLRASCDGQETVIRLRDVDAPEMRGCRQARPRAVLARATLQGLVAHARLAVFPAYRDRWGRWVSTVELGEVGGPDLSTIMLAAGLAQLWPHDDKGRAIAPRPDHCGGSDE